MLSNQRVCTENGYQGGLLIALGEHRLIAKEEGDELPIARSDASDLSRRADEDQWAAVRPSWAGWRNTADCR